MRIYQSKVYFRSRNSRNSIVKAHRLEKKARRYQKFLNVHKEKFKKEDKEISKLKNMRKVKQGLFKKFVPLMN